MQAGDRYVAAMDRSVARGIALVGIVFATVYGIWWTWVAFTGGSVPVPGVGHLVYSQGSLGAGLLVLFVGTPLLDLVIYWACLLLVGVLAVPLNLITRGRTFNQKPRLSATC